MDESFAKPYDLLVGRTTYDIFAAYWPYVKTDPKASDFDALNAQTAEQFNRVTKYVATHRPESLTWQNSRGQWRSPKRGGLLRITKLQSGVSRGTNS
jgi:dihydrofolate reductase